jgi:hypothetical protein
MRLRLTGNYSIDFFKVGPTEVRIVLILVLITELLLPDSIRYFALLVCIILFIVNIIDTHNLLRIAENMDLKGETNPKENKPLDELCGSFLVLVRNY